jgi:hypothetical protein
MVDFKLFVDTASGDRDGKGVHRKGNGNNYNRKKLHFIPGRYLVVLASLPIATKCDLVLKNNTPCEMAGVAMQVSPIRFTASNSN